jgi:tripartite-type tricarboxylate transporter receptor subunit TctC
MPTFRKFKGGDCAFGGRAIQINRYQLASFAPSVAIFNRIRGITMKFPGREFLYLVTGVAVILAVSPIARALDYPTRPVHIIVGFPPGGTQDIFGRLMGQCLSERLGQPFVIENRPGAGGNVGTGLAVRARPDGNTLLSIGSFNTINATLYHNLNFNFAEDIAPVGTFARQLLVMEVNPAFPATTVPEFIAYAKANPGKINFGSGGNGTPAHLAGELFKMMAGVDMVHVPYRGAALALTDLLSGQIQVQFDNVTSSIGLIKAGKLRPLAVTSAMRVKVLQDVPTIGDFVPGYEATTWQGMGAPRDTPADIIDMLNSVINACHANPAMSARITESGAAPFPNSPVGLANLIADDIGKWAKVIKFAGAKAE